MRRPALRVLLFSGEGWKERREGGRIMTRFVSSRSRTCRRRHRREQEGKIAWNVWPESSLAKAPKNTSLQFVSFFSNWHYWYRGKIVTNVSLHCLTKYANLRSLADPQLFSNHLVYVQSGHIEKIFPILLSSSTFHCTRVSWSEVKEAGSLKAASSLSSSNCARVTSILSLFVCTFQARFFCCSLACGKAIKKQGRGRVANLVDEQKC